MKIITNLNIPIAEKTAVTVGFFDGVHLGHKVLLEDLKLHASALGLKSAVITFPVHPRQVLNSEFIPQLLTTTAERVNLLAKTGIDMCILLPFDKEMAKKTSFEFMQTILKDVLNASFLLVGHDHRFGSDRDSDLSTYIEHGKSIGIAVKGDNPYINNDTCISSSVIRRCLNSHKLLEANAFLGYDYFIEGTVVGGKKIGRTIGFPTANIAPTDNRKLLPADGVYAVIVNINEKRHKGMLNIGTRPTINDSHDKSIEVHIIDFEESIYNKLIKVEFVSFLRHEMRFNSLDDLVDQLIKDKTNTQQTLLSINV